MNYEMSNENEPAKLNKISPKLINLNIKYFKPI